MSGTAVKEAPVRKDPVISVLKFRRARWFYLTLYLAALPLLLVFLPPLAFILLVPATLVGGLVFFVRWGRHTLSPEHFQNGESFGDLADALCQAFGTHLFLRERYSNTQDKEAPVSIRKRKSYAGIRSAAPFIVIQAPNHRLVLTPKTYWLVTHGTIISGATNSITLETYELERKVDRPRDDDEVLGQTWRYATKNDDRDLRFNDNYEMWRVRRHAVEIGLANLRWAIRLYGIANARTFLSCLAEITDQPLEEEYWLGDEKAVSSDSAPAIAQERSWHEVLEVSPNASVDEIKRAYRLFLESYDFGEIEAVSAGSRKRLLGDWDVVQRAYRQAIASRGDG